MKFIKKNFPVNTAFSAAATVTASYVPSSVADLGAPPATVVGNAAAVR